MFMLDRFEITAPHNRVVILQQSLKNRFEADYETGCTTMMRESSRNDCTAIAQQLHRCAITSQ
jgi:hypothetical protein